MIKYKEIKGKIKCITGLRIGGKENTAEIGGVENPIIRNPLDGMPYIPGSSLKGKMRFLLEHSKNKVMKEGEPHHCNDENCEICLVFGKKANVNSKDYKLTIGRAIFRDAFLTPESKEKLEQYARETGFYYVERKWENMINRKKGTAEHPREIERIPAGIEFDFTINFRIFKDSDKDLVKVIEEGINLLMKDTLGSSGSRGYGKVEITYEIKDIQE